MKLQKVPETLVDFYICVVCKGGAFNDMRIDYEKYQIFKILYVNEQNVEFNTRFKKIQRNHIV